MTIPLQKTGHQDSRYERPNQKWVCGRLKEGNPCLHGPSQMGKCLAEAQSICAPKKEGDRWFCSRPDHFGGPCQQGALPDGSCSKPEAAQLPCRPELSLRAQRGLLVKLSLILTIGILSLLLFFDSEQMSYISPGELSSAHMAIQHPTGQGANCVVCHEALSEGNHHWLVSAFSRDDDSHQSSQQCLKCHFNKTSEARKNALFVHGMDPESLSLKTEEIKKNQQHNSHNFSNFGAEVDREMSDPLACTTCHTEHHGRTHDLTHMSNTRCQSCHQVQFHSFSKGHPSFEHVQRSTKGINYNHANHKNTHFGDMKFDCRRCHIADPAGKTMQLKSFSETCAGCHAQGSTNHHGDGIKRNLASIFQLPSMEFEGEVNWSEDVAIGDEELSPVLKLLLAGDDEAIEALQSLAEDADWVPLDWESEDDLKVQLAEAYKRLLFDFISEEGELGERLAAALELPANHPTISELTEKFSSSIFAMKAFQSKWLPALEEELEQTGFTAGTGDNPEWPLVDQMTGWQVEAETLSVHYRPTSHADPFFKCLIDALAQRANATDNDTGQENPESFRRVLRTDIFKSLASPEEGGPWFSSCLRCHSVDRTANAYRVNWKPAGRKMGATGFGKFNHRPHMSILNQDNNCLHCHTIHKDAGQTNSRGFLPHQKETCASCHKPGGANSSCLNCHNYHQHRN